MSKVQASQILLGGAKLKATDLSNDKRLPARIQHNQRSQEKVLKLREVDQEKLQLLVKL